MGAAERSYPTSEVRGGNKRSYPASKVSGGGWKELPHAPKPEARGIGREDLPHAPTPEARGGGWEDQPHVLRAMAARAQEGLEELSHIESGRAVVRRYPSSKVRSNGCALLEQP